MQLHVCLCLPGMHHLTGQDQFSGVGHGSFLAKRVSLGCRKVSPSKRHRTRHLKVQSTAGATQTKLFREGAIAGQEKRTDDRKAPLDLR